MTFGLVMHWVVVTFKIPFPGYHEDANDKKSTTKNGQENVEIGTLLPPSEKSNLLLKVESGVTFLDEDEESSASPNLPLWMYFFLAIPSIFDLAATALCMTGLQYLDVSIYQMLRGSGIIFVAIMKQHVLRHHLYSFQWVGVFWNVISVILVGSTAMLNSSNEQNEDNDKSGGQALLGVMLVMLGAFVQACQFVFEEKVMTMDIPTPPLLLIGMEGLWGTVLCLFVVYPLVYVLPGSDHGSFEDPFNTYEMFMNSSTIQHAFMIYFVVIFLYNLFAILVTFMLSSVWHAILDNFRPIFVWTVDLLIFYVIMDGAFGEAWTKYSLVQVLGMFVLLYGTSIYNAPNAGSLFLKGEWWAFGFNCTEEYEEIAEVGEEEELDAHWDNMKAQFKERKNSSFIGEMSPHVSVHTQALRGLASPKI